MLLGQVLVAEAGEIVADADAQIVRERVTDLGPEAVLRAAVGGTENDAAVQPQVEAIGQVVGEMSDEKVRGREVGLP